MKKGVLLIALNSGKYAEMAATLAASLCDFDKEIKIAVITNLKGFIDWAKFDKVIQTDEKNPFKLKTEIYDLTPFEETMFLDVDAIANPAKDISGLFKKLAKKSFVMIELDRHKVSEDVDMMWLKTSQIREQIEGSEELEVPRTNTSLIWFKKDEKNEAFFDRVKHYYSNPLKGHKPIGDFYNDECAYQLASMELKHFTQIKNFDPIYYHWNTDRNWKNFNENFYFLGIGSANITKKHFDHYNRLSRVLERRTGVKTYQQSNSSKYLHNWLEFRSPIRKPK